MNKLMKFVSPRWILVAVSTLASVCVIGGSLGKVNAQSGYESSLSGSYGWAFTALVPVSATAITTNQYQPASLAGLWNFDGKGAFTAIETLCIGGACHEGRNYSGTYTVGADGRGQALFVDGETHTRDFVIVSQGNEVDFIETNHGVIGTGAMKKQ